MKKRGVGEDAVEFAARQIELEEILVPYRAAAVGARHRGEARGAFQPDRDVAKLGKDLQVAPRPAAEIEYGVGRFTLDESQHRRDVLADVVIARSLPEFLRPLVVM